MFIDVVVSIQFTTQHLIILYNELIFSFMVTRCIFIYKKKIQKKKEIFIHILWYKN